MSDRILVMHAGRITGEIVDVTHATQADVLRLATDESPEFPGPTSTSNS
jgi:ABC-type sugar transport system ATPase subunit